MGFCGVYDNFYPPEEVRNAIGYPMIPATLAYESTLKLLQWFWDPVLPVYDQALIKVDKIPE